MQEKPAILRTSFLGHNHHNSTYTYVKLQDAFVSESGVNFGSWAMIGYTMNTTNKVFTYDSSTTTTSNGTGVLSTTAAPVWMATPQAALNDCTTSNFWQLSISKATGTGSNGAVYDAAVSGGAGGPCDVLVPGFGKLDQSGVVGNP